jgi:hypothetical protein
MIRRLCRLALSVCLLLSILSLLERPAYAYIDPGTGLLAYQTLSAMVAGAIFCFRQKFKGLLGSGPASMQDSSSDARDSSLEVN